MAFLATSLASLNAQITTFPYVEDFETGTGGWIANNGTNGTWARGVPAATIINSAASGTNAWVTNLSGLYNNNDNSWVESPVFDFTAVPNPAINAKIWWNAEFSWDGMVLQSSIDNGATWQNVGAFGDPNWYNDNTIGGNPGGQQIGWTGRNSSSNGSGGWVTAFHLLNGLGGQAAVKLRFAFGSDVSGNDEGVAFDLVNIVNLSCNAPSALNVTNVTSTSVDAGWTTNSTATSWQVQYGLQGFALGTGTNIISSANPTTIPSLLPNTQYSYYVRNICGSADTSFWAGPFSFTTLCASQLSGTFTIGATGTYPNFTAAVAALVCGVNGPVVFNVLPGSGPYNEQITIPQVVGTSATNTITFNGSGETITFATTTSNNYIIRLNGADYITFDNLNVVSQSTTNNFAIHLTNDADFNTINNCTIDLTSTFSSTGTTNGGIVVSGSLTSITAAGTSGANNTFTNNTIIGGYYGITINGFSSTVNSLNNTISNNTVQDFYSFGLYFRSISNSTISNNDVSKPTRTQLTTFNGIYFITSGENNLIEANEIHDAFTGVGGVTTSAAYPIFHSSVDATLGNANKVVNNLIYNINTNGTIYGLYNLGSDGVHYYHNTVSLDNQNSTAGITRGIYQTTAASNIEYKNNIVSVTKSGTGTKHCIYMATATTTFVSNNNVFYINAPAGTNNLGFLTANQLTLANWQTASSQDASSSDADPLYVNILSNNYAPTNAAIDGIADATVGVANDFFGTARAVTPDPGAIEFMPPSCLAPSALSAANITATSANLGWTENGTATTWDIEWGTTGFTPTGTPNVIGTTTNPHNLTGLTANTTYEFYVRADCGGTNGVSSWAGPFTFTTGCAAMIAPWIENFENAGTIPNCWNQGIANAENWIFSNTGAGNHIGNNGTITGTTTSGNFFAWVDDSTPNSLNTTLESPFVDVSALTTPMLSFYLISNNEGFTNVNFSVDVWDGAAWNVGFFTSNTNTFNGGWEKINVNLSSLTITGNIKFRFIVDETNGTDFYDDVAIDDVEVKEAPLCTDPSALTATNITTTSANLGWTENGTATTWDIEWGTTGFTPTGTPNVIGTTTNPHNLTGLTANTSYQFYVRADCGGTNGVSSWAGPFSFFTGYCTPSSTSALTYVNNFSTTGGSTNISNLLTGFTTGGYLNASAQTVTSFATGSFTFTADIVGGTAGFSIWVDWNNDLIFDNLTEKVFNTTGFGNGPFTGSITIPTGTAIGNYRMRITTDWNASNPSAPCAAVSRGEFEDYTIAVSTPPSCLAPTALTATNITTTSANLGWTENGTATTWDIEWDLTGFTQGTGTAVITSTNPHNLTGLTSGTSYDFYVRAICGVADTSAWSGPFVFTTLPDYCAGDHFYDNGGLTGNYVNNSNDTTIICPSVPGGFVTVTFLSFDTEAGWDDLTIFNGSGVLGTSFGTFDGTTIPGPFTSTDITGCLTFVFQSDGSVTNSGWDAEITCSAPACSDPSNLTAFNIQPTSAMLDWTENGTATTWNIEWDLTGFTLGTGNPQVVLAKPYLLQGLMPNTSYDYYVQADCGNDSSAWVGPFTFSTPPCMPIALNLGADTTVCSTDTLTLDAGAGPYIYNWSFGATSQIVNLDTSIFGGNGTFNVTVVVTDINTACVYQDNINVTFSTCVGLDEKASLLDFNIYPNPNKGQFTIKLNNKNTTDLRISVTNVQGQEVFVKNNFDNVNVINEQINIGDVKGIYFVNIITNKEVITKKIIVQ